MQGIGLTNLPAVLLLIMTLVCVRNFSAFGDETAAIPDADEPDLDKIEIVLNIEEPKPKNEKLSFSLQLPDGSTREEKTELKFPGTPNEEKILKGFYRIPFYKPLATSETIYEAGKNGYTIKQRYEQLTVHRLGATFLKTASG